MNVPNLEANGTAKDVSQKTEATIWILTKSDNSRLEMCCLF